jgi:antitoxin CcdA
MEQTRRPSPKEERSPRKATNVSLPENLVAQAKQLNVNVSQACERGLAQAVAKTRAERWMEENREAIESSNAYVEKYGLPLAKYRQF